MTTRPTEHVPFQITVHNGEENLEEKVDGVYQHREEVEPRLAGHFVQFACGRRQELDCSGTFGSSGSEVADRTSSR